MSQIIECPGCGKKYRLPETPPATLTCKNCQTLMDLSDFGGRDPEPQVPRTRSNRARGRASGGGGGGAAPSRSGSSRSGSSRSRRAAPPPEEAGGYRGRRGRSQGPNMAAIWGSVGGLVVVIVIAVIALKGGDEDPKDKDGKGKEVATTPVVPLPGSGGSYVPPATNGTSIGGTNAGTSGNGSGTSAGGGATPSDPQPAGDTTGTTPDPATTAAENDSTDLRKKLAGGRDLKKADVANGKMVFLRDYKQQSLKTFPWPDHLGADLKAQVEEAVQGIYDSGRSMKEAREFLMGVDRAALAPVINEFVKLEKDTQMSAPERMSLIMAFDRTLRMIDGVQERYYRNDELKHGSGDKWALRVMKAWNHWYEFENYKIPTKPWDPAVDTKPDASELETGGRKVEDRPKGFDD